MQKINVGVIGLGEVAQIIHLPILEALADRFAISAVCDASPRLLEHVGRRWSVPESRRFTDAHELAAAEDLDAVFVLNSDEYHADGVVAAAGHGRHVLVEKPMCLAPSEAEAIIAARDAAGVHVMVGYMRRFAPAFVRAVEEVRGLDAIRYVRVRDIIGPNRMIIDQGDPVVRTDDIPAELVADRSERARRLVAEAIGEADREIVSTYRLLLGLNSHDLSAMRELIGMPRRVVAAHAWNGGRYLTAIMEYDGFAAILETGVDEQVRFDAHIEVYGATKAVKIQYDTPYIRHLPTRLVVQETRGEQLTESEIRPTFTDPYTNELLAFHDTVTAGTPPKTTPEDYLEDLALTRMIVDAVRASAPVAG